MRVVFRYRYAHTRRYPGGPKSSANVDGGVQLVLRAWRCFVVFGDCGDPVAFLSEGREATDGILGLVFVPGFGDDGGGGRIVGLFLLVLLSVVGDPTSFRLFV